MNQNNGGIDFPSGRIIVGSSTPSRSPPISFPTSGAVGLGANGGLNYILHPVSRFDTLAGVAIKYGVEVADIKRLNGLVSDLQMFALKTLQIPLPGRHPPSPCLSNGHESPPRPNSSENTCSSRRHSDIFDSFQSLKLKSSSERKISPAANSLEGYYGLRSSDQKAAGDGFEMAAYWKGGPRHLEDGQWDRTPPISNPPISLHRKSKSVANCFSSMNGDLNGRFLPQESDNSGSDKWIEKFLRRHKKSETDFTSCTPEKLLKEENSGSSSVSAITGKGLALRPKSASRTASGGVDGEVGSSNLIPLGLGDSVLNESVHVVRKSSSTSSLQESENGTSSSSTWATSKWNLKPDFQVLSTAAITRPIFDGLPKSMGRRNKAALD